jgi:hypothetical protein
VDETPLDGLDPYLWLANWLIGCFRKLADVCAGFIPAVEHAIVYLLMAVAIVMVLVLIEH